MSERLDVALRSWKPSRKLCTLLARLLLLDMGVKVGLLSSRPSWLLAAWDSGPAIVVQTCCDRVRLTAARPQWESGCWLRAACRILAVSSKLTTATAARARAEISYSEVHLGSP